jgi:ATP-dependent DNA helicase RecG
VPVIGNQKVNKEAEITALHRAMAVERRAYYADFQGRRTTFSRFMRQTADRLCKRYPMEHIWTTIRALFSTYSTADVATRISIVHRCEELLAPLLPSLVGESEADGSADAGSAVAPGACNAPLRQDGDTHVGADACANSGETTETHRRGALQAPVQPAKSTGGAAFDQRPQTVALTSTAASTARFTTDPASKSANAAPGSAGFRQKPAAEAQRTPHRKGIESTPVQYVKGVGPKFAVVLNKIGIDTVEDLLRHYPRRHLDFQDRVLIRNLQPGQEVTIFGTILSVNAYQPKSKPMSIISIVIGDGTGKLLINRFIGGKSNKYLLDRYKGQFPKESQVLASGIAQFDSYSGKMTLKNAEIEVLGFTTETDEDGLDVGAASLHAGRLVPVYPLTEGLSLKHLRNVIYNAIQSYSQDIADPLPEAVKSRLNLCHLRSAYEQIHFPENLDACETARRRLVFDELFTIQLQLAQRRYKFDQSEGALEISYKPGGLVDRLLESLPFTLTGAQMRVFAEITRDLAAPKPMHRLVQGDVGSGKTIVALLAFMIAIENGFQCVMMAPTEILAEQHFRQFQRLITPLGLRTCLVVGKQGVKERRQVRAEILSGQIHIAVGTHALLEEDVEFANLGLIIIDEQHRFGVKQRARLKSKSLSPELLTMTATPIPRTLALTMHGDLDVSEIDELPPGRKPIETKQLRPGQKRKLFEFIRKQIDEGRQAYIVFPLIEESETLSAKAATAEYEKLQQEKDFAGLNIGLMHGKLKPQEKEEAMEQFRTGQFHILVCTTVIEVGVDVPNATVMVIENADRFGLAQLHQLRGRVGRGANQSYCFLVSDAKGDATRERLGIMEQTNDGFIIAEKDLELRGPGEFLGFRQSGLPDLTLADLVKDTQTLEEARNTAIELVKEDPALESHPALQQLMQRKSINEPQDIMRSG